MTKKQSVEISPEKLISYYCNGQVKPGHKLYSEYF